MKDLTKTLAHSMAIVHMTFGGLSVRRYRSVQQTMSKIPYLWAEDLLGDGTYVATLCIPIADLLGTLAYINGELHFLGNDLELGFMKVGDSYNFTIPYHMFSDGKWVVDAGKMEADVLKQLSRAQKNGDGASLLVRAHADSV